MVHFQACYGTRAMTSKGQVVESRPFRLMSQGQEVKNGITGDRGQSGNDVGKPWLGPSSLPSSSSMKMLTHGPSFTAPYRGTILGEVSPAHAINSSARNTSMRTWQGAEVAVSQGEGQGLVPQCSCAEAAEVPSDNSEARQAGPRWAYGSLRDETVYPAGSGSTSSTWLKFRPADMCGNT